MLTRSGDGFSVRSLEVTSLLHSLDAPSLLHSLEVVSLLLDLLTTRSLCSATAVSHLQNLLSMVTSESPEAFAASAVEEL